MWHVKQVWHPWHASLCDTTWHNSTKKFKKYTNTQKYQSDNEIDVTHSDTSVIPNYVNPQLTSEGTVGPLYRRGTYFILRTFPLWRLYSSCLGYTSRFSPKSWSSGRFNMRYVIWHRGSIFLLLSAWISNLTYTPPFSFSPNFAKFTAPTLPLLAYAKWEADIS
jgi:hypothetical protein